MAKNPPDPAPVAAYLLDLQDRLCAAFETLDGGAAFSTDRWTRPAGGGGVTRVLENGRVLEKAGVNYSHVKGAALPPAASAARPAIAGRPFEALGLSLVIHPLNPHCPTSHANLRFFIAGGDSTDVLWWFGGGYDLTPWYPYLEDIQHWHRTAHAACAPFGDDIYPRYKKWCDEYFYLPHRGETRGAGGLFFDDLNHWPFARCLEFIRAIGESYLAGYLPLLERRIDLPWNEAERRFQLQRRGRYAEFNLLYDRGTLFGLQSGGRTESILMSLPPLAAWNYDAQPAPDSREAALLRCLRPRDWLSETVL